MKSLLLLVLSLATIVSAAGEIGACNTLRPMDLREVMSVLTNSPWVQTEFDSYRSDRQEGVLFAVIVQLYSALPVRQAIVRRMQLTIPYKELNAQQQADYDAEIEGLLKCPLCSNYYIVVLSSARPDSRADTYTVTSRTMIDVVTLLKSLPDGEIQKRVSLSNDKGERRMAVKHSFQKRNEVVFSSPGLTIRANH